MVKELPRPTASVDKERLHSFPILKKLTFYKLTETKRDFTRSMYSKHLTF